MDKLKTYTDKRGSLTLVEGGHEIPFAITRAYWIYDVPAGEERGKHANKISYQYLIAVSGSVDICLENKSGRTLYHLDSKERDCWFHLRHGTSSPISHPMPCCLCWHRTRMTHRPT